MAGKQLLVIVIRFSLRGVVRGQSLVSGLWVEWLPEGLTGVAVWIGRNRGIVCDCTRLRSRTHSARHAQPRVSPTPTSLTKGEPFTQLIPPPLASLITGEPSQTQLSLPLCVFACLPEHIQTRFSARHLPGNGSIKTLGVPLPRLQQEPGRREGRGGLGCPGLYS